MIVINTKTYLREKQTKALVKAAEKIKTKTIICLQATHLHFAKTSKTDIFAQHIDAIKPERNTGYITANSIKDEKAKGSLLNHSEHPISLQEIKRTLQISNKLKLKVIICTSTIKQAKEILKLKPYAIAFEDPKLIATGKSILKHNPKDLNIFINLFTKKSKTIPLCGAGISTKEDIEEAKKIGCKGVLISSAITKAKNPEKVLEKLSL
ncbi:MAG: triosephosphate isomerase [Patescibacteria group bacterium]|jgi:triosephosphate isomerase